MAVWTDLFGSQAATQEFTEKALQNIWEQIEADPLAGLGIYTKRQRYWDAVVAHHNIVMAQKTGVAPRKPEPIMRETTQPVVTEFQRKAAVITKKAE